MASSFAAAVAKTVALGPKPTGFVTVVTTWNNIFVSLSNMSGQVISKASGGSVGFKASVCDAGDVPPTLFWRAWAVLYAPTLWVLVVLWYATG